MTAALAVSLTSKGYSINYLRDMGARLKDPSEGDFASRIRNLLALLECSDQNYECRFLISWSGKLPELEKGNVELTRDRPATLHSKEEVDFYEQEKEAVVARVTTKALDPYQARRKAEQELERLFSAAKLYLISKDIIVKHDKCLVGDAHNKYHIIKPDWSRLHYIKDSSSPPRDIQRLDAIFASLNSNDIGYLTSSLTYHKLALKADSDEGRLINLWIGLESLVQVGNRNIIERICDYIPTTVATSYLYHILRSLAISIMDIWRNNSTENLLCLLRHSNQYILDPSDLLLILTDEKNGPKISEFLKLVGHDPLLVFRVFRLWEWLARDGKSVTKRIDQHRTNVAWQLRRIYRARNSIVHSGKSPHGVRQLIQHLHTYYISTIHNLIHDIGNHEEWGIRDAMEHRWLAYKLYMKALAEEKGALSHEQIMRPERMDFHRK